MTELASVADAGPGAAAPLASTANAAAAETAAASSMEAEVLELEEGVPRRGRGAVVLDDEDDAAAEESIAPRWGVVVVLVEGGLEGLEEP